MRVLQLHSIEKIDQLAQPEGTVSYTLDSPALQFLTDFTKVQAMTISQNLSAAEAEDSLRSSHVRMKMVVDSQNRFAGILSADNLHGQAIMKKVAGGYSREDLTTRDFMTPKDGLKAFDYKDVSKATIGDVLETLKFAGQRHALVKDKEKGEIRGIISASDIAKKLKVPVSISKESNFSNIFRALRNPD